MSINLDIRQRPCYSTSGQFAQTPDGGVGMAKQSQAGDFSGIALLGGGIVLVTMSVAGYYLGNLLDQKFHTSPKGAIIGLLVGVIIGFVDLYRIASRIMSGQPVPTPAQQQAARENWKKDEKPEDSVGGRDENHE
jgi:F0F1-type ATP synthase assembly protein I